MPTMRVKFWCAAGGHHPVLGLVWHRVAEAEGPEAERYTRYVCNTISAVARSPSECERVAEAFLAVQSGARREAMVEGEDVTLHLSQQGVQVDIEVNEEWTGKNEGHFSLADYLAAVHAWQAFLLIPPGPQAELSIELPATNPSAAQ
jgi:hypothetical protein